MWDYDKLFAEGNIVGIKNKSTNILNSATVYDKSLWGNMGYVDWRNYFNSNLSFISNYFFEIQYIIRLDEHGNVVEKLFDRDTDMPKPMPKLETGMFVRVNDYNGSHIGFVNAENNHVIYQAGGYDFIDDNDINGYGIASKIVEIYGKDTCAFDFCNIDNLIWRKPKSN